MKIFALAFITATITNPVLADGHNATGDAAVGETLFNRQCIACHVVADLDGNVLAGRSARTGPNLFGIAGRDLASIEGFRYSDSILELAEADTIWTEENFTGFVQDPTGWMRATMDQGRARSKMAYRVRAPEDAINIYAFLSSLGGPIE